MKIVQINFVYKYSSTGRTTKEMHESLMQKGYESYVFCSNYHKPEQNIFRIGSSLGHRFHSIASRISGCQGSFSYCSTQKMIRSLRKIQPDVVILRNLHANYINIPLLGRYLSLNDVPVVNVLHDCWSYTGHCCYYTEDNCGKWKTGCFECPIMHKYNKSYFFDTSRKMFKMKYDFFHSIPRLAVVGVSDWVSNESKQSPIFANAMIIKRIYNWIDHSVFYPRDCKSKVREKLGLSDNDFVVLGVAQRWSERKGLNHFISVAQKLKEFKFVMIGGMPNNISFPNNIIHVAPTSSTDELAEFYSMSDVFLNFSIQETFGKVSAEALSCGLPLVINNATANTELCGSGCGYLIDNNDEDRIIEKLVIIRKEGKEQYKDRCRNFSLANFSKDKGIGAYTDLFKSLLDN